MKRDPWVLTGLAVVAVTAIAASFTTLTGLALWVGWNSWIGWLLPLCLDVLALTAGRVWLADFAVEHVRRYARLVSLIALGVSVLGNAAGHIVTMEHASLVKITLAIIVGAIPPVALAAVGDLATMATVAKPKPAPVAEVVAVSTEPVEEPKPVAEHVPQEPKTQRRGRPAKKTQIALAHWEAERAQGRTPTPAELARVASADDSMARRWVKRFAAEEMKGPGASLTLVKA